MIGGVFADRRDRRHMILFSQIIQMLVALIPAGLIFTRRVHITHVLALFHRRLCPRFEAKRELQRRLVEFVKHRAEEEGWKPKEESLTDYPTITTSVQ